MLLQLARMIPLFVMESQPNSDDEPDPFLTLFSEIRETLNQIRDRLPEQPDPDVLDLTNHEQGQEQEQESDEESEPKIEVEQQPPVPEKRVPWRKSR